MAARDATPPPLAARRRARRAPRARARAGTGRRSGHADDDRARPDGHGPGPCADDAGHVRHRPTGDRDDTGPDLHDAAADHRRRPPPATATTPPPAAAQPAPATTTTAPASDGGAPKGLVALVVLIALVVLLALAWAIAWWQGLEPPWWPRVRHSLAEFGWRASGAWADFADWMRFGR